MVLNFKKFKWDSKVIISKGIHKGGQEPKFKFFEENSIFLDAFLANTIFLPPTPHPAPPPHTPWKKSADSTDHLYVFVWIRGTLCMIQLFWFTFDRITRTTLAKSSPVSRPRNTANLPEVMQSPSTPTRRPNTSWTRPDNLPRGSSGPEAASITPEMLLTGHPAGPRVSVPTEPDSGQPLEGNHFEKNFKLFWLFFIFYINFETEIFQFNLFFFSELNPFSLNRITVTATRCAWLSSTTSTPTASSGTMWPAITGNRPSANLDHQEDFSTEPILCCYKSYKSVIYFYNYLK